MNVTTATMFVRRRIEGEGARLAAAERPIISVHDLTTAAAIQHHLLW